MDWGLDGKNMLSEYGFTDGIDSEGKGDAIWAYRKEGKPKGPYLKFLEERGLLDDYLSIYDPDSENLLFEAANPLPDHAYCDNWIAQNGLDLLSSFSKDQPWHLVVNFAGPHDPYDVTEAMSDRWKDAGFPLPVDNDEDDRETIRLRQQNYAAMIENIDIQIGRYLELLDERGELDNTIIVFSSDHGEMLGEHNRWAKSVWHEGAVKIPLIVSGPSVPPSQQSGTAGRVNLIVS
jgi:arylsulfatase